jgi:integrase
MSCARFGAYSANKSRDRRSSSRRSAVHRSRRPGSLAWSSGPVELPGCRSKRHLHMLRHACGFALANKGHDTRALQACLGQHKNIQHTVRYTELAPPRFKNFWR